MKRLLLVVMLALVSVSVILAQRNVAGTVTDTKGVPLIGVSILAKGTTTGTITDVDGSYSLRVPEGASVLVFSYTGFATQELTLGATGTLNVIMAEAAAQLTEVVVTSLGIKKEKRALGYAVTTIDAGLIEKRPEADVSRILQGKVPGVNITSTGGVSGTGTNIIIRGYSSFTGSNQPLFVVDGVPFNSSTNQQNGFTTGGVTTSSRMLDLDPNSIESVSVLKGLSATLLYGDQGRNGVILVTTKGSGKTKAKTADISINQSYYQNTIASLPVYQSNYGGGFQQLTGDAWFFSNWGANFKDVTLVPHPIGMSGVARIRDNFPQYAVDPTKPWGPATATTRANIVRYDNKAYETIDNSFFRKGQVLNTAVQISGATDRTSYGASVGLQDEEGFTPGNSLKKLNLGLNFNTDISDKLALTTSFQYAGTDMKTPPLNAGYGSNADGGIPSAFANVLYTPRNVDLRNIPYENPVDRSSVYFRGGNDITHPLWLVKHYSNTSNVNRFFNSSQLVYSLTENLGITYRVGYDTYTEEQETRLNKGGTGGNTNVINGYYKSVTIQNTIWNNDLILNFKQGLTNTLTLNAMLGGNYRDDQYKQFGLASTGQLAFDLFRHANFSTVASSDPFTGVNLNYEVQERRAGVYSHITLDYNDYLFANVSARNDWTSTVEEENRRILYPGASLSFIPTTAFDVRSNMLQYLKLRLGYGTSAGFPRPYQTRSILNQDARSWIDPGGIVLPNQNISTVLGNPNLKPELHKETELGIESVMFNNKLKFDVSVFQKNTNDLITSAPIDPSTGYNSTTINIGKMRTRGVEASATVTPVKTLSGITWDVTANFSKYESIVQELSDGLKKVGIAGFTNLGNFAIPGKPFGIIEGLGIQRDPQGNKIVSATGNYLVSAGNVELGDPNPAFNSSLINSFNYKGFNLSFMLEYRHKGVIVSNTVKGVLARGLTKDTDILDRELSLILPGVKAVSATEFVKNDIQTTAANYFFNNYFFSDEAITFDGSTFRLREVSLSYALPKSLVEKTPFKAASLTISGSNLWFRALNFPKYVNFDTDVLSTGVGNSLGFDFLTGPSARRLGGTLNLTF